MDLEIPDELEYEILTKVSVKNLLSFRCVCKRWRALLSSHKFRFDHYKHSLLKDAQVLIPERILDVATRDFCIEVRIIDRNFECDLRRFVVRPSGIWQSITPVQSCKGLVCLGDQNRAFVLNPATRQLIETPPCSESTESLGFGYIDNEFRVVRFFKDHRLRVSCQIFTLGAQWRNSLHEPQQTSTLYTYEAPFIHGAIHRLPCLRSSKEQYAICAFDLTTEESRSIPIPHFISAAITGEIEPMWMARDVEEEYLAIVFDYGEKVDVWVLSDYESQNWIKWYSIDLANPNILGSLPLKLLQRGKMLIELMIPFQGDESIFCYDPAAQLFTLKPHDMSSAGKAVWFEETLFGE